ncbi:MAG: CoA transferase [Chitinophagaceae bacterium]|nr:MAG: CoA transferase [Chitinophagaceae bacterium]
MDILKGIKVIDMSTVLAGPSVGSFLAELGAEVLKIENKRTKGDNTRTWKLDNESTPEHLSAYYLSVNYGKKLMYADLTDSKDLQQIKKLVKGTDIFLTNLSEAKLQTYNLDYSNLEKINKSLIYGWITGFFDQSERLAYDLILQAESGFMSINGSDTSGPLKMPVALIDVLAAHQLKEGILTALLRRERNNEGSHIKVSLFQAAVSALTNQASNWLIANKLPGLSGSLHPNIAPYGEQCKTKDDKSIVLAIGSNRQFEGLCKFLELEKLPLDQRFQTNEMRVNNRLILLEFLQDAFKKVNSTATLEYCHKNGIPVAEIKNIKEVFENTEAMELIIEQETEGYKSKYVKQQAFKFP